ncbi:sodium:alanine symporter family protein [Thiomicrospira sp. WB1]|uniref:alanine/glycine:cation symporter family protein n=1 Tax=Thiomicrospira sp. WB1 TaxID=1685380 RepID=UPI0007486093|nr:amino acid carrier protein [Thiomicrospira sp. WB1]KUJ72572.1 sodium/alanine symporter [Thiomicrospira sp. WB1]
MQPLSQFLQEAVGLIWGPPMIILLVGGGLWLTLQGRFYPFRHLSHSLAILTGRYDRANAAGDISHRQALSAALAGTLGLGNLAGVALALSAGGPGAIFWMWLSALVGISTKFFTGSLAVMYRGHDTNGQLQGGPMYVIEQGLGRQWKPLAVFFAIAGLLGTLPAFQINQLTEVITTQLPAEAMALPEWVWLSLLGALLMALVASVIWGGLQRLAMVAVTLVPSMVILYLIMTVSVLAQHASDLPGILATIFYQAWSPDAIYGGLLGVMIIGISRGAFSNEAGIGTEVMAHGAAKTDEPIREGLVASLGPIIDTLIVCTATALVILATGVLTPDTELSGIDLTLQAFGEGIGLFGTLGVSVMVLVLSLTTVITFWYYGHKCFGYLFGADKAAVFKYLYLLTVFLGAVLSIEVVFYFLIGFYGLMAIPTMTATLLLAPHVKAQARRYFQMRSDTPP